jgi:dolichol kinase
MEIRSELARQIAHLLLGVAALGVFSFFYFLSPQWHALSVSAALLALYVLVLLIFAKSSFRKIPLVDSLFARLGYRDEFPGEGALWYALGILLVLSFFTSFANVFSTIYILAVGDSVSTAINLPRPAMRYRRSIFKNKTPLSVAAFIVFSLPVAFFLGAKAVPLVFACAVVEALDIKVNDNFLIPLVCVILLNLL